MKALCLLLLLGGCGLYTTHEARDPLGRDSMIGRNVTDLIDCAGTPDTVLQTSVDQMVLQYTYKDDSVGVKAEFMTAGIEIGGGGSCKAVFTVLRDGTVVDVTFPGAHASGMSDRYESCVPIVQECISHPGSTSLPKGYDAFTYFLPAAKPKG